MSICWYTDKEKSKTITDGMRRQSSSYWRGCDWPDSTGRVNICRQTTMAAAEVRSTRTGDNDQHHRFTCLCNSHLCNQLPRCCVIDVPLLMMLIAGSFPMIHWTSTYPSVCQWNINIKLCLYLIKSYSHKSTGILDKSWAMINNYTVYLINIKWPS